MATTGSSGKGWLHEAATDDGGQFDAGNIGLLTLVGSVLGAIPFACVMLVVHATLAVYKLDFPFDVQALGIAVGAICAGFATSLAAYAATRSGRPPKRGDSQQQEN